MRPEEKHAFETLLRLHPDFADSQIVKWEPYPHDPPDVFCLDDKGERIGVEITRMLNPEQTNSSKTHDRTTNLFHQVVGSEEISPPQNIGMVWIHPKLNIRRLPEDDANAFRGELFKCIEKIDAEWPNNPDWHSPQGHKLSEFDSPLLSRYLSQLDFFPKSRYKPTLGVRWIILPHRGGSYSPDDAVRTGIERIHHKVKKCADTKSKHQLHSLHLLVDYNWEAFAYNTPFRTPDVGFEEFASKVAQRTQGIVTPFDKIFLVNTVEGEQEVVQILSARVSDTLGSRVSS